jgi:hypothetical protein
MKLEPPAGVDVQIADPPTAWGLAQTAWLY